MPTPSLEGHTCGHACIHSPAASVFSPLYDLIQSSHSSAVAALFHLSLALVHGTKISLIDAINPAYLQPQRAAVQFSKQPRRQSCMGLLECWTQSQRTAQRRAAASIHAGWGDDEAARGCLSPCRTRRVCFVSVVFEHLSVLVIHTQQRAQVFCKSSETLLSSPK